MILVLQDTDKIKQIKSNQMNFIISSLLAVCFLPSNRGNFIELYNDVDQNVTDDNPEKGNTINKFNIYLYERPIPNMRRSLDNKVPRDWTESELNRVIKGHKLQEFLSQDEIHEIKVKEICGFIRTHYLSAQYFFNEMRRIVTQREVVDDLRNMVTYFEENPNLKPKILEAYRKIKQLKRTIPDMWSLQTNNLVAFNDASRFK